MYQSKLGNNNKILTNPEKSLIYILTYSQQQQKKTRLQNAYVNKIEKKRQLFRVKYW